MDFPNVNLDSVVTSNGLLSAFLLTKNGLAQVEAGKFEIYFSRPIIAQMVTNMT